MKKIANSGLILLLLAATVACHRPYALLQRTPAEQFIAKQPAIASKPTLSEPANLPQSEWPTDSLPAEAIVPPMLASAAPESKVPVSSRVEHHMRAVNRLLAASANEQMIDAQPRPKPKTQRKGMTLREFLGLPEKRPKTWWQRINWNIKAGFVLILIAVVFALLKVTILAIIFGILAALILLRGMRKTWKRGSFLGL